MVAKSQAAANMISGKDEEHFDPDAYLINIVRRAIANNQDIAISLDSVGAIQLLSGQGEYYGKVNNMEAFCSAPANQFKVDILTPEAVAELSVTGPAVGRNIDELMWNAGYYASRGRLPLGCGRDDVVDLKQWPNLTRLPAPPNAMRIAALMSHHPTSITLASRMLKIPYSEFYQFYSAARFAGIAEAINKRAQQTGEAELKPHRNPTRLSQILARISRS